MLNLKGNSLGQRQKELNEEVFKATSKNIDFSLIKDAEEHSDVDRLYKIDVASAYKNVDYIIETLKCGDSLYISRALKCTWLYGSDFISLINPDYLHHNIFPFMSMKMKKKMLITLSMHIQDENRAVYFYKYCCTDLKLENIALKFLIRTSEQNKMDYISSKNVDEAKIKAIVGSSFSLAEACLVKEKNNRYRTNMKIYELRYLYTISNDTFLDLVEKYTMCQPNSTEYRLGLRVSKDIITKHKNRVIKNLQLYLTILNMNTVAKHFLVEDAKLCALAIVSLLPPTAENFWSMDFYQSYKMILHLLPENEIYLFLKQIFESKYPAEPFEMSKNFYNLEYYKLFSDKERELWALEHLKHENDFLGQEQDYLWYRFVNYELAFREIQKYIFVTNDRHKRANIVNVLIDCVKNEEQLEMLIQYYYDRHVNESENAKLAFIDNLIGQHNIFKVGESCWNIFYKLLHSSNVFMYHSYYYNCYKIFPIIYCIIHNKAIPDILDKYIMTTDIIHAVPDLEKLCNQLTDQQIILVFQYFINLCVNKMKHFDTQTYDDVIKFNARDIITYALLVIQKFEKTIHDCPDIIMKYTKLDWPHYKNYDIFVSKQEHSQAKLLRVLKQDSDLFLKSISDLLNSLSIRVTINSVLKKIKIYYLNDVAKDLLSCCEGWLLQESSYPNILLNTSIIAIFLVSSDDYKISFMTKHVPKQPVICYDKIGDQSVDIQKGICKFAHYSRPPVPLSSILPYLTGDYVQYCLPMFKSYQVNLPKSHCIKFISATLNKPVSIQKHALRLAFQSFDIEDLKNVIVNVWKTSKNVSVRKTIYKALFDNIRIQNENSQTQLYEVFKMFTLSLNENDDQEVYYLLERFDLAKYKGDFLETVWESVRKLSDTKTKNINRKFMVIRKISSEIEIMDKEYCRVHILNDFVHSKLIEDNILQINKNSKMEDLVNAKWELVAKYIIYVNKDKTESSYELVHLILQKCSEIWDTADGGIYTIRKFMFSFIDKILCCSHYYHDKAESIPVLKCIMKLITELLPMSQIYALYVKLNFIIISKKVIGPNMTNYDQFHETNIANELASEVLTFLNNLKNKKLLYSSFYNCISSSLCNAIMTMCYNTNLNHLGVTILISSYLIETELPEAHLLALMMLPNKRPKHYKQICSDVIKKIESRDNSELHAYLYQNFFYRHFESV